MSERRCPKCGTVYVDSARFCPRDGNMLVEVQAKAATPRPAPGPSSQGGTAVRTPPQAKPGLDRASSLLGEVLDSRYQVQKKLGEGAGRGPRRRGLGLHLHEHVAVAGAEPGAVDVHGPALGTA